ncbi:MAG: hypothetical protein V7K71_15975 [Nostoc sp.]|uniref:hypothetical protein n=1 Tax=Nostoc sp. TaxID=1180 RepID=UPI002FF68907
MGKKTVKKTAHIRLFQGNITQGCPITELKIYQGKQEIAHCFGKLPKDSELYDSLQSFLSQGENIGEQSESPTRSPRHTLPKSVVTNPDPKQDLEQKFNDWLNSEDFEGIKEFFISYARNFDVLIIESNQLEIKRLPWSCWEIIKTYCPNIVVSYTS